MIFTYKINKASQITIFELYWSKFLYDDLYLYTTNLWCLDNHQTSSQNFTLPPKAAPNQLQVYYFNNKGHKAPSIADTPAGRYAGSLFTSASKT